MERDRLFNVLTIAILGLTIVTILCYIGIAINPFMPINPFPPDLTPQFVIASNTPTPTPTRTALATWTPTTTPTITPTPPASFTPTATPTATPVTPTPTRTSTPTPTPRVTRSPFPFTYELNYETPVYGCSWQGVAGNVVDIDGNPLEGYPIHVWGGGIDAVVNSGSNQRYGDAGWEQFFFNQPQEMRGVFRVQIHDRETRQPVSAEIELNFEGYCSQALANITFVKNH